MRGLIRWTEPPGITRLRQDMDELFDRFFDREDWMPGRMMRSMRSFQRDLDNLFGGFFGDDWGVPTGPEEAGSFWPRLETALREGEQVLRLELPGFSADTIQVHVAGTTLHLQGERKLGEEKEGTSQRRFSVSYTLPEAVDPDNVKASLANGILEIRLPVSPKLAGKRVPVQVGAGGEKKQLKAA